MLYGTVKYGLKAGGDSDLDWAARAHLVKEDGRVKMDFYQVYLVRRNKKLESGPELTISRTLVLKLNNVEGTRSSWLK